MWKFLNTWKKRLCAFVLALLLPAMVFGAVTYNTAGTSPGASSTTCVITAPTGITVGNLLIASCSFDDGGASTVSLSGWTVVKKTQIGSYTLATLAKIADSGDTSAGTFTFTTTGSSASNVGGMIRLSGTASTVATAIDTVVDSSVSGAARVSNTSSNTITSTSDIIVMVGGARDDNSWSLGDMTNTQNGSTMDGFTRTERVEVATTQGNDTSVAIDTAEWDGTGTGLPFGNMNRSNTVSAMAMQMFVVHQAVVPSIPPSTDIIVAD